MSYERMVKTEVQLEVEIAASRGKAEASLAEAEEVDRAEDDRFAPDRGGDELPDELCSARLAGLGYRSRGMTVDHSSWPTPSSNRARRSRGRPPLLEPRSAAGSSGARSQDGLGDTRPPGDAKHGCALGRFSVLGSSQRLIVVLEPPDGPTATVQSVTPGQ
jgi:hypothetical protein